MWDLDPCFSSPTPEGRSSPTNTPIFPPSSFILPSFVWFYIFFSTGQVLLSVLSWCSACTSVPDSVFLMYPWRDVLHVHLLLRHLVLSRILLINEILLLRTGASLMKHQSAFQYRRHKKHRRNSWVRKIPRRREQQSQYSCLGNPMDRGACMAIVHRVAKDSGMT